MNLSQKKKAAPSEQSFSFVGMGRLPRPAGSVRGEVQNKKTAFTAFMPPPFCASLIKASFERFAKKRRQLLRNSLFLLSGWGDYLALRAR